MYSVAVTFQFRCAKQTEKWRLVVVLQTSLEKNNILWQISFFISYDEKQAFPDDNRENKIPKLSTWKLAVKYSQ